MLLDIYVLSCNSFVFLPRHGHFLEIYRKEVFPFLCVPVYPNHIGVKYFLIAVGRGTLSHVFALPKGKQIFYLYFEGSIRLEFLRRMTQFAPTQDN